MNQLFSTFSLRAAIGSAVLAVATLAAGTVSAAEAGKVAYYGTKFAGRTTANGERFNPHAMTMAHKTLPFGSKVRVTNTANHRSVIVRVNDRGPTTPDRVGDVTLAAAKKLRMLKPGVINAKLAVVGRGRRK